jgi:hypothetical protein
MILSPSIEENGYASHFYDLDTGLRIHWPADLPRDTPADSPKLAKWAQENGIDLMCVALEVPDAARTYALRPFGLRVTEITEADARNLQKRIQAGGLPEGRPVDDLLLHADPATNDLVADANAAFLYVTREGGQGMLEVTDRITKTANLNGALGAPAGTGFYLGVKFNHWPIAP